jgi:hypothetical protein
MFDNYSAFQNAVASPLGGLGGTKSAQAFSGTFFLPASYYSAPKMPTMRANLPSDLGFDGFNTRNTKRNTGLLSSFLTGDNAGNLLTQRPTLLPV